MGDRRGDPLVGAAVLAVAAAVRSLPLVRSPLPFNPDGVVHAAHARTALATGSLPTSQLATDDVLFTGLLSAAGATTGGSPLLVAQPVAVVVGATPCLLAAALARRWARRRGWSPGYVRLAAGAAGLGLAVEGLYLHRSLPADEQTVGLLVVPLVAVAYRRWLAGGGRRWAAVAALLAAGLPPLHNLDSLVAGLVLTALLAAAAPGRSPRWVARAAAPVAAFWAYFAGYVVAVDRLTPAGVVQAGRLVAVPGLVAAWVVLLVVAVPWLRGRPAPARRRAVGAVAAVPFVLLAANAAGPVFPGTPATDPVLLAGLLPLAIPVWLAVRSVGGEAVVGDGGTGAREGVPDARDDETGVRDDGAGVRDDGTGAPGGRLRSAAGPRGLAAALVAGPAALVGVALLAALTPDYLATAYRALAFVHLPVLALAGVGAAGVARGPRPRLRGGAVVAALLVAAAASVPVAVGGLAVLPYAGVTTPGELAAAGFAEERVPGTWATDDHLARLATYRDPRPAVARVPVYEWLLGAGPPPGCPTLVQRSWTTTGAQVYPAPPARPPAESYAGWRANGSVVYAGGGADRLALVVPRDASGCRSAPVGRP